MMCTGSSERRLAMLSSGSAAVLGAGRQHNRPAMSAVKTKCEATKLDLLLMTYWITPWYYFRTRIQLRKIAGDRLEELKP
jgi:hypothetical protein